MTWAVLHMVCMTRGERSRHDHSADIAVQCHALLVRLGGEGILAAGIDCFAHGADGLQRVGQDALGHRRTSVVTKHYALAAHNA